jgi:hypothetical protein
MVGAFLGIAGAIYGFPILGTAAATACLGAAWLLYLL